MLYHITEIDIASLLLVSEIHADNLQGSSFSHSTKGQGTTMIESIYSKIIMRSLVIVDFKFY